VLQSTVERGLNGLIGQTIWEEELEFSYTMWVEGLVIGMGLTVPPHNIEAEKAVLGSILIEPEQFENVIEVISDSDFYDPRHRMIFSSMLSLYDKSIPIDVITLFEELKKQGNKAENITSEFVREIMDSAPVFANAMHYANIVKQKALLREIIHAASEMTKEALDENRSADEVLETAERVIYNISEKHLTKSFTHISTVLETVMEQISDMYEKHKKGQPATLGIPSGFDDLDKVFTGFNSTDYIVIAARPGMGKTSFALSLAKNITDMYHASVAIFSLEMSNEQLLYRLFSMSSNIPLSQVKRGDLNDFLWKNAVVKADDIMNLKIWLDDDPYLTPRILRTKLRKLLREADIKVVFIDYLQLMTTDKRNFDNRQQEISEISRNIKLIAKEFNVCIVVLSQLSRAVEQRDDKKPKLSDLRESGAIEQDADVVMFLYRPSYYTKKDDDKSAEIIVGKQRNGPIGSVTLGFDPKYTVFSDKII